MPFTRVIILANSVKKGGRCVAGKQYNNNNIEGWVRPINASNALNDALTVSNIQYSNFKAPSPLDIVDIHYLQSVPHEFQIENASIDTAKKWVKYGAYPIANLAYLTDTPQTLWHNDNSSYNGLNDRFNKSLLPTPTNSLYFIQINDLVIRSSREGLSFGDDRKK